MKITKESSTFRKCSSIVLLLAGLLQGCHESQSGFQDISSKQDDEICQTSFAQKSYLTDVLTSQARNVATEPNVLRERTVEIDVDSLRKDLLRFRNRGIHLDLFHDKSFSVKVDSLQVSRDQSLTMTGHLVNQPESHVTLSIHEQTVVGHLQSNENQSYEIQALNSKVQVVREIDSSSDEEECEAIESPEPRTLIPSEESAAPIALEALPTIDMLVAYTPAAKAKAGGKEAMEATIRMGIADTNRAYLDSGVALAVRLVGTMEVSQNESTNFSSDLGALKSKSDGKWDEVHPERVRLGADQITLVGAYPNTSVAGIGYIGSVSSSAVTIVKYSAFRIFTFSHELGHNIGLNHSDGLQNITGNFRTIMAYGSQPRIRRFSHPGLPYKQYITGDSTHNSAAILNAYGKMVAGFAKPLVPISDSEPVETPAIPIECH